MWESYVLIFLKKECEIVHCFGMSCAKTHGKNFCHQRMQDANNTTCHPFALGGKTKTFRTAGLHGLEVTLQSFRLPRTLSRVTKD